jgi:CheY-like chemotaxis protein
MQRILVADDDPGVRQLLKTVLELLGGYQVVEAVNGSQALLLAQVEQPVLVILDRRMPGLTGDEVCSELRRHPATSALPVVMLSTDSGDDVQGYAFLAGANAFVQKPFHPSQLLETVNRLLSK